MKKKSLVSKLTQEAADSLLYVAEKSWRISPDELNPNQQNYSDGDYNRQKKLRGAYALMGLGMGGFAVCSGIAGAANMISSVIDGVKYFSEPSNQYLAGQTYHFIQSNCFLFLALAGVKTVSPIANRIELLTKKIEKYKSQHPTID
ncbi:Uncharacterised protein [uncultured archaeon]|nr:Uncharacterised protein [uncultured archaeon]